MAKLKPEEKNAPVVEVTETANSAEGVTETGTDNVKEVIPEEEQAPAIEEAEVTEAKPKGKAKVVEAVATATVAREKQVSVICLVDHVCRIGNVNYTLTKNNTCKLPDHVVGMLERQVIVRRTN